MAKKQTASNTGAIPPHFIFELRNVTEAAARVGEAARKHVQDSLRIEACFDAYETLYRRTLDAAVD
ncbi:MAG: hypothetical protein IID07_07350 [Gemmatimonadetes bacterium]|nr:hypothetical protein [Gemmatimonadota bacterium]